MNVTEHIIIIDVGELESNAFREWPLLTTVIIGETVENINSGAFASCTKLEYVQFPDKLMSGIGGGAFAECISLNNITIRCNSISDNAFYKCTGLETITLYEGVRNIGADAFRGCTILVNIYIPSSVTSIGNAFLECTNLQFINVSDENIGYSSYENDGVLYNKEITQIISYPNGNSKTFSIPKSVISIMNYTFAYCNNLERIFIDENVQYINSCAFVNCTSLQCIYFNGEISPKIQNDAFVNINAATVMTIETYQNETFGNMEITKGTTLDACLPPTRTFTDSNTFTISNTFIKSNTFTKSKNTFESNTYVDTFSMNFTFVNTYTLTYFLSFIKTLSIYYYTFLKSYSVTFIESETKYIYVDFIYYNYTIIYYPEYFTYYSNFFYISYIEDVIINTDDNNTLIIIIIVVVIVIIIVFVLIIIIFMIKYQNMKRKQNEEEMNFSDENNNKINEIDNTFSVGNNNSNIEEDPFAVDFKEEKFISQI